MNAILFATILSLVASPIFGQEIQADKKVEKRGILGLGYGGYYGAYNGLSGYGGYLNTPVYTAYNNYPAYTQGYIAPASPGYAAPASTGYAAPASPGYAAPVYSAPVTAGYSANTAYNGLGLSRGLGYVHG